MFAKERVASERSEDGVELVEPEILDICPSGLLSTCSLCLRRGDVVAANDFSVEDLWLNVLRHSSDYVKESNRDGRNRGKLLYESGSGYGAASIHAS